MAQGDFVIPAPVSLTGQRLKDLADPTTATDGASKQYVDAVIVPRNWLKAPWVRLATTGPGTLASSFENGDSLDGGTLATGDVILIKDQANPAENGIYTVNASGAPTRHAELDASAEFVPGSFVRIGEGNTNGNTTWVLTVVPPVTVGTTPIYWAKVYNGNINAIKGDKTVAAVQVVVEAHTDDDDPLRVVMYVQGASAIADRIAALQGYEGSTPVRLVLQPLGGTVEYATVPTQNSHLANKQYVDRRSNRAPNGFVARVATTAAGTLASSFENGDTIDGVVLATSDIILIKDQANPAENGIYTVNASGAPTRHTNFDTAAEMLTNTHVYVTAGTANANTRWVFTTTGTITVGTTSLVFVLDDTDGNVYAFLGLKTTAGYLSAIEARSKDATPLRGFLALVGAAAVGDRRVELQGIDAGTGVEMRVNPYGGLFTSYVEPTVDKSVTTKLYVDNRAFKSASTGDVSTGGSTSSVNLHSVVVPGDAIDVGSVYAYRALAEVTSTAGGGRRILACQYGGGDFLVLDTDAGDALADNDLLCYFNVEIHVISTSLWYYRAEWWDSSWPGSTSPAKKQAAVATNLAAGTTFRLRAHTLNGSDTIVGKVLSIGRIA